MALRGSGKKLPPGVRKVYAFRLSEGERTLMGSFERIMKYGNVKACFDFVNQNLDSVNEDLVSLKRGADF